jgi:hypothetical protein
LGFGVGGFFSFFSIPNVVSWCSNHVLQGSPQCVLQDVPNSTSILSEFFPWTRGFIVTSGYPRPSARRKRAGKKNLGINPGQPVGKGREKKKKENPGINPGQVRRLHSEPAGKGWEKKKKKKTWY